MRCTTLPSSFSILCKTAKRDLDVLDKLGVQLKYIFETHVHADHITGASVLKDKTSAKICYGSKSGVKGADIYLDDNEILSLGNHNIKAIHTPGHTSGCSSFYIEGYIF